MIEKLQHRYALSERGAKDLVQGVIACTVQNIAFMFPVSLLYFFGGRSFGSEASMAAGSRFMSLVLCSA